MKLCETSSELTEPATRRLAVLRAAAVEAAFEGMEGALADNLAEIERLRRELAARVSRTASQEGA